MKRVICVLMLMAAGCGMEQQPAQWIGPQDDNERAGWRWSMCNSALGFAVVRSGELPESIWTQAGDAQRRAQSLNRGQPGAFNVEPYELNVEDGHR